ncbi:unnamed protein product [Camellia sinensis]
MEREREGREEEEAASSPSSSLTAVAAAVAAVAAAPPRRCRRCLRLRPVSTSSSVFMAPSSPALPLLLLLLLLLPPPSLFLSFLPLLRFFFLKIRPQNDVLGATGKGDRVVLPTIRSHRKVASVDLLAFFEEFVEVTKKIGYPSFYF